jgi:hypothetical protein
LPTTRAPFQSVPTSIMYTGKGSKYGTCAFVRSNSPVWQMRVATNVVPPWLCGPSRGVLPQKVDRSLFLFRPICRKEWLNSSLGNFPTQSKRGHFQRCRETYRRPLGSAEAKIEMLALVVDVCLSAPPIGLCVDYDTVFDNKPTDQKSMKTVT